MRLSDFVFQMMPHQQQEIGSLPDEFLEQMLSSLPSWNDDFAPHSHSHIKSATNWDDSALMHQINVNGISTSMPMPPTSQNNNSPNSGLEMSIQGVYNGFAESQQFLWSQQGVAPPAAEGNIGSGSGQPTQRVRARRGQATDPHSISERLRRERIAERMKGLQELVPNANKTDKASMLDEIIDYVKFLQLQVKVLSMSRLGGAAAVAPLLAEAERGDAIGIGSGATSSEEAVPLTMTEQQVAKLMDENMGSAMQYLQGKGLCLMPISLATAISRATSHSHIPHSHNNNSNVNGGPTSPTASVLTVQSSAIP